MQVRFQAISGGNTYTYLVRVAVSAHALEADEYPLLDDTVDQDIRKVRLLFEIEGVLEQTAGTALSLNELWLALIRATRYNFRILDTATAAECEVIPDTARAPSFYERVGLRTIRGRPIRLLSKLRYNPTDPLLDHFAALTPN